MLCVTENNINEYANRQKIATPMPTESKAAFSFLGFTQALLTLITKQHGAATLEKSALERVPATPGLGMLENLGDDPAGRSHFKPPKVCV